MKVLIIDDLHPVFFDLLKESSFDITYNPEITREELKEEIKDKDVLVVRSKTFIDEDLLQNANEIKVIFRAGSGMDNIDEKYCKLRNIELHNVPEANANAVAEHALALLFNLIRNINQSYSEIKNGEWKREENRGVELSSLHIGVIGYGHTGSSFAHKLSLLGAKVLVYDKYKNINSSFQIENASIETIQEKCDVISFHVPLTEETKYYFDDKFLEKCQKKIFLLNTSRGKILKTETLLKGLQAFKINGLGIDVLENEKLNSYNFEEKNNFSNLISFPNVLITSHIAGWTSESYRKIAQAIAKKLLKISN